MRERLIHILDQSACLSRRQMTEYAAGSMIREEAYALEQHLNTCPLCSTAIDGMLMSNPQEAQAAVASLNGDFLKNHFATITPQIHLNSMTASVSNTAGDMPRNTRSASPALRIGSIAAGLLLCVGTLWYMKFGRNNNFQEKPITAAAPLAINEKPVTATTQVTPHSVVVPVKIKHTPKPSPGNSGNKGNGSSGGPQLGIASEKVINNKDEKEKKVTEPSSTKQEVAAGGERTDRAIQNKTADVAASGNANADVAAVPAAATNYAGAPVSTPSAGNRLFAAKMAAGKEKAADQKDNMEEGDKLLNQNKYGSALVQYKKDLKSTDESRRHKATVKAAECYANMGNKAKAKQMLQALIDEGGPEKHAAKKLLHDLDKEDK